MVFDIRFQGYKDHAACIGENHFFSSVVLKENIILQKNKNNCLV